MKTDVKKRKKGNEAKPGLLKSYTLFREYGLPVIVLLFAYIGYKIRAVTSGYKTFLDPDTFFHFEMYKQAINEWIPKYYAYAEPPMGIKASGYLGLYTMEALFYKVTHSLFGWDELQAFKVWPPLVGALIVIAVFLVGRKLHSNWAGFWGAGLMMGFYGAITKTYSGNNRGEGPFLMFFLFSLYFLLVYLDEKGWNWKKIAGLAGFLILSPVYMGVWSGSSLGLMIFLATGAVVPVVFFTLGRMNELRRFVSEYYLPLGASIVLGLIGAHVGFVGIKSFLVFALEVFLAMVALALVMIYGESAGLNYSDATHRLGTVAAVAIAGFIAIYAYFGKGLVNFLKSATRSTPLYQTVAELQGISWDEIIRTFSVQKTDGILFFLSMAGLLVLLWRFYRHAKAGDYKLYKDFIPIFYYLGVLYLFNQAVRFSFQASGAVMLLTGIALGEAFLAVETMKDTVTTKALYAVFLALILLPMPYLSANYSYTNQKRMADSYRTINPEMPGSVPKAWTDALLWLRENSNPYATVLSWWDYGYWEESSLLSHRRAVSDGGHGYDRRYLIARFFSHSGAMGEVDLEAWEDKYVITFLDPFDGQSDFGKFNAIAYLGGAIRYGEGTAMFGYVQAQDILLQNDTVYVNLGNNQYIQPEMTVDLINGKVYKASGSASPYVLYVVPYKTSNNQVYPVGILAYNKIAFSNYVRLALQLPLSVEEWEGQKLFSNFRLVYTGYNGIMEREYGVKVPSVRVYEFTPFAIYRMDRYVNDTWETFYTPTNGGKLQPGEQRLRLWISAFGRDIKNGTIVFEAYNGTELVKREVLAENVYIDHLNETPIEVNLYVPNATKYRFLLIQEGPVGVTNGPVYVNGELANPSWVIAPGNSGIIELTEAFDREYSNVKFTLRGVVYYYIAPNGPDIYNPNFYLEPHMDIVGYIPVKTIESVNKGDNVITGKASVPEGFVESYVNELKEKYGDKVVIVGKRIEPIFIAKKTYVLWEG